MAGDDKQPDAVNLDSDGTVSADSGSGPRQRATAFVEPHDRIGGSVSAERFLIGRVLGEGGMAVVHEATDVQLNRPVAIKRMRSELSHREDARQRFFAEAEILAGLDHPGTTAVFDAGRLPDGDCFYAMKKVRGRTLAELLADRRDREIGDRTVRAHLLEVFFRVCQTVASAHKQGVIHRDLKPENIMVDDLGVVYVMDWGLAKQLEEDDHGNLSDSERTRLGAVMGTPAYMSPEQASGHAATSDRQTDVFSLGVMLYEILTGVNPFRGATAVESMKGVMYHNPDPPRTRNKRIDRTLSAITMKAIDKDPFRRYRSAAELAEDLRCYREFQTVSAIEPTAVDRLVNWSRRRPRLATAAATLTVVVVVAALATAFEASLENARVAQAYGLIDNIEVELRQTRADIATARQRLAETPPGPERQEIEARLAALQARLEVADDERRAIALAITGFTILSPDHRAVAIVRQSILENIRTALEVGDYYRARAEIDAALRNVEKRNIFGFSDAEHEELRQELENAERNIEAAELARPSAGAESEPAASPFP
jgi:serine/threonine protein kinase